MNAITDMVQQDQKYDWVFTLTIAGQDIKSFKVVDFQRRSPYGVYGIRESDVLLR